MAFLKTILKWMVSTTDLDLESEVQTITEQLVNRNTEHEKLATFKENLKTTYTEVSNNCSGPEQTITIIRMVYLKTVELELY